MRLDLKCRFVFHFVLFLSLCVCLCAFFIYAHWASAHAATRFIGLVGCCRSFFLLSLVFGFQTYRKRKLNELHAPMNCMNTNEYLSLL